MKYIPYISLHQCVSSEGLKNTLDYNMTKEVIDVRDGAMTLQEIKEILVCLCTT